VEPGIVSCDPEAEGKKKRTRDREDEKPPSADRKKRRGREKISGATCGPVPVVSPPHASSKVVGASGVTGTIVLSEVKEKKERRKNKSSAETSDAHTSVTGPAPIPNASDELGKPRKHKPTKGNTSVAARSKPKSKKRKEMEGGEHQSTSILTEGHPPRKRKKFKQPTHPDPSEDPDLTEQSQKALTYIYFQSTSPETWKFNKARQNWVIRNVWTSKVPDRYVSMVVEHLFKVQGQARETLIESCNALISGSSLESPGTQPGTNEKSSSENASPSTPEATSNEKKKWAETLLDALTSKS